MRAKVQKWGNSLALGIPKALALEVGFDRDLEVELFVERGRLVAEPRVTPSYTLEELLAGVRASNLQSETDWGTPAGKEIW